MKIDKETYKLGEDNYVHLVSRKQRIVFGNTFTNGMKHFIGWNKRWFGKYTKTATYTIGINGDIYDGMLDSNISVANISSNPEYDVDLTFDGIQISKIPIVEEYEAYQISGLAEGNLVYSNKEVKAGKGSAGIIITKSAVKFTPALFGLDQLEFKTINAVFEIIVFEENDLQPILDLLIHDKKNEYGKIQFALLDGIGNIKINQEVENELIIKSFTDYKS